MKNPWLSMWLRAANSMLGAARGHAGNAVRRQQADAMRAASRAAADFWSGAAGAPKAGVKRRARKR